MRVAAKHLEQRVDVGGFGEARRCLERVEPRVSTWVVDGAHVFDVDVFDLRDLVDEQVDQAGLGQRDDELVDGSPRAPLEDLDADDVATYRADAARDLSERAGPIRQPDAHRVVLHRHAPYEMRM